MASTPSSSPSDDAVCIESTPHSLLFRNLLVADSMTSFQFRRTHPSCHIVRLLRTFLLGACFLVPFPFSSTYCFWTFSPVSLLSFLLHRFRTNPPPSQSSSILIAPSTVNCFAACMNCHLAQARARAHVHFLHHYSHTHHDLPSAGTRHNGINRAPVHENSQTRNPLRKSPGLVTGPDDLMYTVRFLRAAGVGINLVTLLSGSGLGISDLLPFYTTPRFWIVVVVLGAWAPPSVLQTGLSSRITGDPFAACLVCRGSGLSNVCMQHRGCDRDQCLFSSRLRKIDRAHPVKNRAHLLMVCVRARRPSRGF